MPSCHHNLGVNEHACAQSCAFTLAVFADDHHSTFPFAFTKASVDDVAAVTFIQLGERSKVDDSFRATRGHARIGATLHWWVGKCVLVSSTPEYLLNVPAFVVLPLITPKPEVWLFRGVGAPCTAMAIRRRSMSSERWKKNIYNFLYLYTP